MMLIFFIIFVYLYIYIYKKERYLSSDDDLWEDKRNIEYNNCYAYAFTDIDSNRLMKPQPGFKKNLELLNRSNYSCSALIERVLGDFPDSTYIDNNPESNYIRCSDGYHLVFLAIDSENRDYHFYRRNSNGLWTHKPGSTEVIHIDASNNIITNPFLSNRSFKDYQYKIPCGFFCVKTER